MNNYQPHIFVLPEDDANRSLANGFFTHQKLTIRNFHIQKPLGGWCKVFDEFNENQIKKMSDYPKRILIMLIDFDKDYNSRIEKFHEAIPKDIKDRVFVLGVLSKPEELPSPHGEKGLEQHGLNLADDCANEQNKNIHWNNDLLKHNLVELNGRIQQLKDLLFQ